VAALVAVAVIAFGVFVAFVIAMNVRDQNLPRTDLTVSWLLRVAGGLIVAVTAVAMLVAALLGEPLDRLVALTLPLLGGSLLVAQHWSTAIALGLVGVAVVARDRFPARTPPPGGE
jgi:hypothetical protein